LVRAVCALHKKQRGCAYIEASLPTLARRHQWPVHTWSNATGALDTLGIGLKHGLPGGAPACFVKGFKPAGGRFSDERAVLERGLTRPRCPVDRIYHPAKMATWRRESG
jgi:hypothetical protein